MIYENIAGSILATQTQRQQRYKEKKLQETSDTRQKDKEHKAAYVRVRSEKGACLSPYIRSFDFFPY